MVNGVPFEHKSGVGSRLESQKVGFFHQKTNPKMERAAQEAALF
jgi:hypothetical protein